MPAVRTTTFTRQFRDWSGGMNRTASRTTLDDREAYLLDSLQPIGPGQLVSLPGPGPAVATISAGIASLWGVLLRLGGQVVGRLITVNQDGSLSAIDPTTGSVTTIGPAGTVTTAARLTTWRDELVLIGDPTRGYFSWDGTTLLRYPVTLTGTLTANSPIVTSVSPNTTGLRPGMAIAGTGIPTGTTILTVDSASQLTLNQNATASGTGVTLTIGAGAPSSVRDVAVYSGRVWLVTASRTITFTAPGSWTDFSLAAAAGTTVVTDAAFQGGITRLLSALELLWIVGPAAVNAISNVQVSAGTTTFTNTNIVSGLGSAFPSSVVSYFRTFLFLAPTGVYAILGATPQKLSRQLDGLMPLLVLSGDQPAMVFALNRVFVWGVLVSLTSPPPTRPVLLIFSEGRWFLARQGDGLRWVASLVDPSTGQPEPWGTDGTTVFRLFAGTGSWPFTLQTKLWDFGAFTQRKQIVRIALELDAGSTVPDDMRVDIENETMALGAGLTLGTTFNRVIWTNTTGGVVTWVNATGGAVAWIVGGILTARAAIGFGGNRVGFRVAGTSRPITITGLAWEIAPHGEWTS